MKKRTFCILAAAFIAWNGIYTPVHADNVFTEEVETVDSENNSTDGSISIQYASAKPSNRYRVEIDWGEMEFCYHPAEKVWDTIDLKWKQPASKAKGTWTTKSGKEFADGIPTIDVKLRNYSSNAIQAHFLSNGKEFTDAIVPVENGITLQLKSGNPRVNKAVENPEQDKSGEPTEETFVIALGGEPEFPLDPTDFTTTIPVTCTIEPAS